MLSFKNVSFSYGGKPVLENFCLSISEGERTALAGLSGSGKTTLFHLASGIYEPQSGSVERFSGKASFLFQENRLFPWYSAEENLLAVGITKEKTSLYLSKTGLASAADKLPSELSGGMQRRLAIARALAFGGEIFFFDEPMQGLDPETAAEILSLIKAETEGKTLFLITHSEKEADFLCERKISVGGSPLKILSDTKK